MAPSIDDHQSDARETREQAAGDAESGQQFDDADEEDDRLRKSEVFGAPFGIARVREAAPDEDEAGESAQREKGDLFEVEHGVGNLSHRFLKCSRACGDEHRRDHQQRATGSQKSKNVAPRITMPRAILMKCVAGSTYETTRSGSGSDAIGKM